MTGPQLFALQKVATTNSKLSALSTLISKRLSAIKAFQAATSKVGKAGADISSLDPTVLSSAEESQLVRSYPASLTKQFDTDLKSRMQALTVIGGLDERVFFSPGAASGAWDIEAHAVGIIYKGVPGDSLVVSRLSGPVLYCNDPRRNLYVQGSVGSGFLVKGPKDQLYICTAKHVFDNISNPGDYCICFAYEGTTAGKYVPAASAVLRFPSTGRVDGWNSADISLFPVPPGSTTITPLTMSMLPIHSADRLVAFGYPNGWALNFGGADDLQPRVALADAAGIVCNTNLSLSPQESGGPVFNMDHKVVGVVKGGLAVNQMHPDTPQGCFVETCAAFRVCPPGDDYANLICPITATGLK